MNSTTSHISGIRRILLTPLAFFILALSMAIAFGFIWFAQGVLEKSLERRINGVEAMLHEETERESQLLKGMLGDVMALPCAAPAFLARDRERLMDCTKTLYSEMRVRYQVNHFYFHTIAKEVFLRVHNPARHGDIITRFTLERAAETNASAAGLEVGPYGAFVLRMVIPWEVDGKVIGYLELGKEIDEFVSEIKEALTTDLIVLMSKEHTTRQGWEEGLRVLGKEEDWTEYDDMVVVYRTTRVWTPEFNIFGHEHSEVGAHDDVIHIKQDNRLYHVSALPLLDVQGHNVGHIVVLIDVSAEQQHLTIVMALTMVSVLSISLIFAVYLWRNIGRFEAMLFGTQNRHEELRLQRDNLEAALQESQKAQNLNESLLRRTIVEKQLLLELLSLALKPTTMAEYLEQSLKRLLESISWVEHLPEAVVFVVNYEEGRPYLKQVANYNLAAALVKRCDRVNLGECLCGRAAQSEKILFSEHVDEQHDISFDHMTPHGQWVVPIRYEGTLVGVFNIYVPDGTHRDERTESLLSEVAKVIAGGIYQRLKHTLE